MALKVNGITVVNNSQAANVTSLTVSGGSITAGGGTGTSGQFLQSTGSGVCWGTVSTNPTLSSCNSLLVGGGTNGTGTNNISFGLNPAARIVLNSVFLAEAVKRGLDSAIVHPSKIMPIHKITEEQLNATLDLIYDRRKYDENGEIIYDPLNKLLEIFSGVEITSSKESRAADLAALSLTDRLQRRIIDGEKVGLNIDFEDEIVAASALTHNGSRRNS